MEKLARLLAAAFLAAATAAVAQPNTDDGEIVTTKHTITADGKHLAYTARAGFIPLRDKATGEVRAKIFFVSYSADSKRGSPARPLTFYNTGGPGAPAMLDDIGPRALKGVKNPNQLPLPPYRMTDNRNTWLTFTDLVLFDPVGTGFSKATKPDYAAAYYGRDNDAETIAQVIENYLRRFEAGKQQPVFVAGVSYGTMRSALVADIAKRHGISLRGLVLLSSCLGDIPSHKVAKPAIGEVNFAYDDPYYVRLFPTFTATAFFHHKLAPELQNNFDSTRAEAEAWATHRYRQILTEADRLPGEKRESAAAEMARLTGLSPQTVLQYRFKLLPDAFLRELLGESWTPLGINDARLVKADEADNGYDRNRSSVLASLYLDGELGFKTDAHYVDSLDAYLSVLDDGWHCGGSGENDCSSGTQALAGLERAMREDRSLKAVVIDGYYDLNCPYFASMDALNSFEPDTRARIAIVNMHTGHDTLQAARAFVADFVRKTLAIPGK